MPTRYTACKQATRELVARKIKQNPDKHHVRQTGAISDILPRIAPKVLS